MLITIVQNFAITNVQKHGIPDRPKYPALFLATSYVGIMQGLLSLTRRPEVPFTKRGGGGNRTGLNYCDSQGAFTNAPEATSCHMAKSQLATRAQESRPGIVET